VACGGKALHQRAGLRDDRLGRRVPNAGNGLQQQNLLLPRAHRLLDPVAHLFEEPGELINQAQVLATQKPMMLTETAHQRIHQLRHPRTKRPFARSASPMGRVEPFRDERLDDRPPGYAEKIGHHTRDLDLGVLQRLLDSRRWT